MSRHSTRRVRGARALGQERLPKTAPLQVQQLCHVHRVDSGLNVKLLFNSKAKQPRHGRPRLVGWMIRFEGKAAVLVNRSLNYGSIFDAVSGKAVGLNPLVVIDLVVVPPISLNHRAGYRTQNGTLGVLSI